MSFLNDILNLLMPLSSKKITNNDEKSIFSLLFAEKVRTLQRKRKMLHHISRMHF